MSTIVILSPVIIGSWPVISSAIAAAAVGMGLTVKEAVQEANAQVEVNLEQVVEVEVENSEILAGQVATGQEMVLTKDGITLRITRDDRGQCKVCAEGKGYAKAELKRFAEEFTQKMTQCFV